MLTAATAPPAKGGAEWVPIACPDCGSRDHRQYGWGTVEGQRYHICRACGVKFRSLEVSAKTIRRPRPGDPDSLREGSDESG